MCMQIQCLIKETFLFYHLLHPSNFISILRSVFASFCEGVDLSSQLLPGFFAVKKCLPKHM